MILYEILFSLGFVLLLGGIYFKRFLKDEMDYDKHEGDITDKQLVVIRISMITIGVVLVGFVLYKTVIF